MNGTWSPITPLVMLYVGLLVFALVDWVRYPRTLRLNRWVWLAIIVIFSLVGPLAYLLLGRERSTRG